jgi:excisionase family DNA binding protein
MSAQREINPTDHFSNEQLDALAFALYNRIQKLVDPDRPMRLKEAAEYLGISYRHLQNLINSGALKSHRIDGQPFLLRSEIIHKIKTS